MDDDRKISHCCLRCGFTPIEGMQEFLRIHGEDVLCLMCEYPLVGAPDPYPDLAEESEPASID